ncbi:hypothetical protein SAMN05518672_11635 [Chitinophaga sp. CF118]|uniref:hypothetical protein n=1 Tax=Chitinophaga sp. CF118 TaxID=1884367 RepID=UPI0008E600C2|nr:hypothetical protein [Chitinophaga sp. CF118]SFF09842.1 hypothetical protein SAMN05518672_11635 [Chitinophaga sp. CF118]
MNEIKEKELFSKSSKLLDIAAYYDFEHLDFHKFLKKYKYFGDGIYNPTEIRFRSNDFAFKEVMKILEINKEYYFIPVDGDTLKVYKANKHEINTSLCENSESHFIILDDTLEWVLIKTSYNKIIGLGDIMKNKIKSIAAGIDMKNVMGMVNC